MLQDGPITKHNELRQWPALTWSQTLENYATAHSQKCAFEHSGEPYGENMTLSYSIKTAAVDG